MLIPEIARNNSSQPVTRQPRLGILEQEYHGVASASTAPQNLYQWTKFVAFVQNLNQRCEAGESYKLLYLIRHGLGVHNIVMKEVGSTAWKEHLSRLDGDDSRVWADAHLVEEGIAQVEELAQFWLDCVQNEGMPLPESVYTSPLARCLETTKLVFAPVMEARGRALRPIIKESLRERLTDHTCDRRSSRSWIKQEYPQYVIENGFREDDTLWNAEMEETVGAHVARKQLLLEDIFDNDDSQFISLTTHSYAISAILKAVGAPHFRVGEGVMVPLFVKAEKIGPR